MGYEHARGGSLFSLGDVPADALPQFLQILRTHQSKKRLSQIIEALFDLCAESPDGQIDRESLCDHIDITRSGLLANLKKLDALGMLEQSEVRPDEKRRRVVNYSLTLPTNLPRSDDLFVDMFDGQVINLEDAEAAKLDEHNAINALISQPDTIACQHSDPDKTTFKGERLSVFTLAPALNVGRQEATSKTTRIWRGRRSFEVTLRALTGHRIPNVHDLRPLVVAWTLARDQLPNMGDSAPSQPIFVMTLTDICRHLGFDRPTANNKRQTFNRLRRFRSSEWQLTDDRYNVLRSLRTGGLLERDKYMSFISDLETVSSVGARGKTPEVIAITFHPAFTPVLTDMERSLTLHKEFIQGKYREFDQLIYQWCRTTVQHNHEPTEYALDRVHREAHPSVSMTQFCSGLERMAADSRYQQVPDMGHPMLLIPGYQLSFDLRTNKLVASARTDDRHLGTSSKYALANQGKLHYSSRGGCPAPNPLRQQQPALPGFADPQAHAQMLDETPEPDLGDQSVWKKCLQELDKSLPADVFSKWVLPLTCFATKDKVWLGAPNRYCVEYLEKELIVQLQTVLRNLYGNDQLQLKLLVAGFDDLARIAQNYRDASV